MSPRLAVTTSAAIDAWRQHLAADRDVFEPRANGGAAAWQRVAPGDPPSDRGGGRPPLEPAKRFFFPPRDVVVRWSGEAADDALAPPRPFALLDVRACDLAAIAHQDRFFADDAAYGLRRARALLVGRSCRSACPGGFCRDVGAGPFAREGFDVALTELDAGEVAVEIATEAGEDALRAIGADLRPASEGTRAALASARRDAEATFPPRPFVARAIARVAGEPAARPVADAEWQELGPSCLSCTGCTSVCPTCSCFTLVDEPSAERDARGRPLAGERVRIWDSCLLEGFQREASGHHPAPRPGDRVRRFWFHKLSRDFPGFERVGCVGCGRCDVACPGSIGALRVLARLGASAEDGAVRGGERSCRDATEVPS